MQIFQTLSAVWMPALLLIETAATAPASDFKCSFNGEYKNEACECTSGWMGARCQELKLRPVVHGSGLDLLHDGGPPLSTWGGSVVRGEDGQYHMFASLITRHCGIHPWISNSVVIHATAASAFGPYLVERGENGEISDEAIIMPLFAHEPLATRAPDGTYVLFFTAYNGSAADEPPCECKDGDSSSGNCFNEPGFGANKSAYTYISSAPEPEGPWSEPVSLAALQDNAQIDMNFAPVIRPDGSALGWTRWNIWTSNRWDDPSSYRDAGQAPAWSNVSFWEGEDPFVWVDQEGHYHMLSHNGARGKGGTAADPQGDCGRHWFSESGAAGSWNAVGDADGPLALGGCAYPRTGVTFSDGSASDFYRRERPHLIFDADGTTPLALTTAASSPI